MLRFFASLARLRAAGLFLHVLGSLTLAVSTGSITAQSLPHVSIAGPNQVRYGGSVQLSAATGQVAGTAPVWLVNGTVGGTDALGRISTSGVYTPSASIWPGHTVTISVASSAKAAPLGSLVVTILNPLATLTSGTVSRTAQAATFSLDLLGSGFLSTTQVQVSGANVASTLVSSTELQSTVSLPAGTNTFRVGVLNPNAAQSTPATQILSVPPILLASVAQATRLLDQTSFGPTLDTIQHVQLIGTAAYLTEQFATPTTRMPAIPSGTVATCPDANYRCVQSSFWRNALTAPDQLRQRVAFALSEMLVVSTEEVNARTIPSYHNLLADDAFGNFRQIMMDVTTSPAMGAYLNMLNSGAAPAGQIANENYARELMQLFATGLYLSNPDGSLQFDAQGQPQPVYTEAQVQAYARALTGWTYASASGGVPPSFPNGIPNFDQPMQPLDISHDMSSKILLNGVTLSPGQSTREDLGGAIDSIFNHPNVGPFVGRQLIQHLVTSNPSPAYVSRISAVFANDGSGVRGNMRAVITAILNDPEARAADASPTVDGGHLREPILYLTGILRALAFKNVNSQGRYDAATSYTAPLGETPYGSPSVFNFFPPSYVMPGTTMNAPEFAQENTAAETLRMNLADAVVRNHLTSFAIDMSATSFLGKTASATGNPQVDSVNLVNALNMLFTHNQMPASMQASIAAQAAGMSDVGQRVRVATWLVISSNFYKINH